MLKITIPTPCHEDWNKMTSDETGRHCRSCAKSVVDFTAMSDEEVKYFFINKQEEKVCGRFKQTQLHSIVIELPQNIFSIQMPLWKKFLAACLVVFSTTLFSCETKIKDKVAAQVGTENIQLNQMNDHIMVGGIAYTLMPDTVRVDVCPTTVGEISAPPIIVDTPIILKGDIDIIDVDTATPTKQIVIVPQFIKKGEVDATYTSYTLGKLTINDAVTPAKTKNPPKADSINCNTIKNYY